MDYGFLELLLKETTHIHMSRGGEKNTGMVTLYVPIGYIEKAWVMILLFSDGNCYRYDFTSEPPPAPLLSSIANPLQEIKDFLAE